MAKKTKRSVKRAFANFFGGIGYSFVALQWAWSAMLYSGALVSFVEFIKPEVTEEKVVIVQSVDANEAANPILMIFAAIVVFIVFLIIIYIFVKAPSATVKAAKSVVHQTAEYVTPAVLSVYHEKDTPVKHSKVKQRLIFVGKILVILIPLVAGSLSFLLDNQKIEYYIAEIVCIWLAGFSIFSFMIQYILAKTLSVKLRDLW